MSKFVKNLYESVGWERKAGPPKVWRTVEGRKKTEDGRILKFSIEEVPEDRYDDVLDLMGTVYVSDEALCRYLGMKDDPEAMKDFSSQWNFALQQGVVTGAFVVEENNPRPVLAGVTMNVIWTDAVERCIDIIKPNSEKCSRFINFFREIESDKSTRELYGVDSFVTGFGFCVDPRYRGQGLAYQLIKSREDVARAYNVGALSAPYTAPQAVKAATEAGWEILAERNFMDTRNEDGTPGKLITPCKLMAKRIL